MPWGIAAAVGGTVVSGLVNDAMSPGTTTSGGGSAPPYYVPSGLGTADQTWQNLLNQELASQGQAYSMIPYYQQSLQRGLAGEQMYGTGYQNAATQAGNFDQDLAAYFNQQGNQNFGTQADLLGAGRQVFNLGLDPQSALYNRTVQQLQDQTGATNSMYGLGSSAAGAGVANQALSNFNIGWQNNQLSRALQGLQGYSGAASTAGRYGELGTQQLSSVPQYMLKSGQLPYTVNQSMSALPGQLAGTYAGQIQQGPLSSAESMMGYIVPYMNYGQGAQAVPYQNQANNAAQWGGVAGNAFNTAFSSPSVQNGISNIFSPASGSFSGGDFSGAFTSNPYYGGGGNSWGFTLQ